MTLKEWAGENENIFLNEGESFNRGWKKRFCWTGAVRVDFTDTDYEKELKSESLFPLKLLW